MAKFFKSTAFKCTAFLLILAVLLGGILAILNDLLYVSPSERTARAIEKIYGTQVQYETIIDVDDTSIALDKQQKIVYDNVGEISKVYKVANGDYLFKSTGYNGYKQGTITLWITVKEIDEVYQIQKVILEEYKKQTLMSELSSLYPQFEYVDLTEDYFNGTAFSPNEKDNPAQLTPVTGATMSATAGANAVNAVVKYIGEVLENE